MKRVRVGGHLKDIPLPHKRYWPNNSRKRTATLRLSSYRKHWFAWVYEEDNPIWNSSIDKRTGAPIGWQVCHDDKKKSRRVDSGSKYKFDRKSEALHWGLGVLDTEFPDHKHYINNSTKFYYLREGD